MISPARLRTPPHRHAKAIGAGLAVALALVAVHAVAAPIATLPSITAEHVIRHEPSGTELARARLELSPHGMRVRQLGDGAQLEMIEDFVGERVWLVDRERGIAHELPSADAGSGGVDAANPDGDGERVDLPDPAALIGVATPVPCAGLDGRRERASRWRGQRAELWTCLDEGGTPVTVEIYSLDWNVVVRRGHNDGIVEELHDLREREFDERRFVAPSRLRPVGKEEFFGGAPPIGRFVEREPSTNPSQNTSPE